MSNRSFRKLSNGPSRRPRFSRELESGRQRAFYSSGRQDAVRLCWRELLLLRVKPTSSRSRVLNSSASGSGNQRRPYGRSLEKVVPPPHPLSSSTNWTLLLLGEGRGLATATPQSV